MSKLGLKRRQVAIVLLVIGIVACGLFVYRSIGGKQVPTLQQMKMTMERESALQVYEGQPWTPGAADGEGFVPALENDRFALRIHPQTTQVIVTDKRTGREWRSNPPEERLRSETVKGLFLANLKSPFTMEYFRAAGDDKARREITNATDPQLEKTFVKYGKGLQITYFFQKMGIQFSLQYELTDTGMDVKVPTNGIEERSEYALFSLDVLPYLGAAQAGENGYILVPDGPGGLIRFDAVRAGVTQGYVHPIYGSEVSNVRPDLKAARREVKRETIAYPVFGMKRGDQAFVAIVRNGKYNASIQALPPGLKSSYYSASASFRFREEYLRRMSRIAAPVKAVEKERAPLDCSIEYRFLNGDQANYVGMAHAYQQVMAEQRDLPQQLNPVAHIPLQLNVFGGNARDAFNGFQYVAATTFAQATEIASQLKDSGVDNMRIVYYGWQNGGDLNAMQPFPIENKLGGQAAAKSFIDSMHKLNYKVLFEDNFVYVDDRSSLPAKTNGVRGIDGTVFYNRNHEYLLKPALTAGYAYEAIDRLNKIGVDGIHYNWLGELTFRDYESPPTERDQTANVYRQLLAYTREQLGDTGVYQGNDYVLGETGYIGDFALDSSYDFMVDETVPFYPIVVHGFVPYAAEPANFRNDDTKDLLRAIEYGALPAFDVTWEPSRVLKNTPSDYVFSSEFALWKERIVKEYRDFDKLSGLYNRKITNHEQIASGMFVTTYEDGTRVVVDYGRNTFEVRKGGAE